MCPQTAFKSFRQSAVAPVAARSTLFPNRAYLTDDAVAPVAARSTLFPNRAYLTDDAVAPAAGTTRAPAAQTLPAAVGCRVGLSGE